MSPPKCVSESQSHEDQKWESDGKRGLAQEGSFQESVWASPSSGIQSEKRPDADQEKDEDWPQTLEEVSAYCVK